MKKYIRIPNRRFVPTKKMIEDAIENTQSNAEAARWLGISYNTYKKYSQLYDLFEINKNMPGKGISRNFKKYKCDLHEILENKHPDYPHDKLIKRLVNEGLFEEKCHLCNWDEKRITDDKICLGLDFIDSDKQNYNFENLRLLCPNCYYNNVGEFANSKRFCK
tara:strand:- start:328 stop:816 length:489 start_codon:yes stop_codon:yes gene_type:complete